MLCGRTLVHIMTPRTFVSIERLSAILRGDDTVSWPDVTSDDSLLAVKISEKRELNEKLLVACEHYPVLFATDFAYKTNASFQSGWLTYCDSAQMAARVLNRTDYLESALQLTHRGVATGESE